MTRWRLAAAAAVAGLLLSVARAQPTPPSALGLIVKLKDAPAHEALDAERFERPQQRALAVQRAALEQQRWQRVLAAPALAQRGARLRAVGRDQHHLRFGTALPAAEAERLLQAVRALPEVQWAEADTREPLAQVPTDPLFPQQWWLRPAGGTNANVLADRLRGVPGFLRAWQSGIPGANGSAAAVVAVLDTGTTAHPDLAGRFLPGYDFVSEAVFANDGGGRDSDPSDPGDWVSSADLADRAFDGCTVANSSWHGTLIAGLIAAATDNAEGGAGITRGNARILPVRVAGKCGAALSDIVDGMRWAAGLAVPGAPVNRNPARIINISFGGSAACGPTYQSAIDELRAAGVVVVAAAGNAASTAVTRPASCSDAVGVVALNRDGFKSTYSGFGGPLSSRSVATVGGDDSDGRWGPLLADGGLVSVYNNGQRGPGNATYAGLFGTSFAAPLVAGTVSLMLSVNPQLSWQQIVDGLQRTARPHVTSPRIAACSDSNPGRCICSTSSCGAGIVDAEQAMRFAQAPTSYVAPVFALEVIDNPEVVQAVALGQDRGNAPGGVGPGVGGSGGGSGTGGGALGWPWLGGLVLAAVLLRRRTPR